MAERISYKFLFNELVDHLSNIYDQDELCARLLEIGLNQWELYDMGFDVKDIEKGKEIRKEWLGK